MAAASSSLQYDAAIGGSVELPSEIDMVRFAEERRDEVCLMIRKMASNEHQRKLMHQSLPLHMRRRAMSYNPKRLPRKFRAVHVAQFSKSGVSEKKKRPSRRFRRKPHNLLKEYERRKRAFVWLETHVWHARRFHMVSRWGYKIPQTPCNKGYRSSYRATSKHALLHDLSYEGCVEVRGPESTLFDGLRRMGSERVGLTMAAKAYGAGTRAGYVWLFEDGHYPYGCLGRVRFVWRATVANDQRGRTVWIFAHPSFYRRLVEQLVSIFGLKNALRETADTLEDITRNPADIRCPRYSTSTAAGTVEVIELKDTLNRFHLTGPLAQATLAKALKLYQAPEQTASSPQHWFTDYSTPKSFRKILNHQTAYWDAVKDLTSPGELSPGEAIGLVIEDPRLNRPQRRTKALPSRIQARYAALATDDGLLAPTTNTCFSPLWDETIRNRITEEQKSTHELNVMRSREALVPGERCASEAYLQPVPILLLQTPGSQDAAYKRLGYGSGWDVIVPAGYGLPLWHSLTRWGAKAAGQKELEMIAIESGCDRSGVPDTILGRTESATAYQDAVARYFRRPNNRRVNYTKLAIASPFRCPWQQLVQEWNRSKEEMGSDTSPTQFFVLRDRDALAKLRLAFERKFNLRSINLPPDALVPLLLTLKTRGNPGENALICLPKREDFRANRVARIGGDHSPVYTEPLRKDPHEHERKKLRTEHLRTLKRLRRQRVREKKRRQRTNPGQLVKIAAASNAVRVREQLERMAELWLPGKPANGIRNQCSRECFGYVTQCCFTLTEGNVTGIGYVTVKGLEKLFKVCNKGTFKVLLRGTKSRGYRFATIRLGGEA
ncbi:ribonucleases P/MRP protein subunit POP1 [Anopheles aquasalis]|uniref:ribonucleases P/MRP protein subunit POP1 n=1 Tax=Anopheles aquasalis TaxID=42839 RepID=UPI00215B642E|nr:ribonucleases P/MRP protein subunit POP1 [Anopheles aquasalis]